MLQYTVFAINFWTDLETSNKTGYIEKYTTSVRRPKISVGLHSCQISKFRENKFITSTPYYIGNLIFRLSETRKQCHYTSFLAKTVVADVVNVLFVEVKQASYSVLCRCC
jgi:hypothetical protein